MSKKEKTQANLQIVILPIDSLTPYEKNARQHKELDVEVIKKSIEEFGFNDPIGIWGDKNIIVEGHGRLAALKQLGWKEVPCIRLDHLTNEQRKAYALTHNRSAEMSSWDIEALDEELKALEGDFDLSALGFEEFLNNEEPEVGDDDFNEDDFISETPESKLGDIYVLNNHRVMCGDSTKKEVVAKLVNEKVIDFVVTDPPYNVDYVGKTADALKIQNDKKSDSDFRSFLDLSFINLFENMKPGANIFVFHADSEEENFRAAFKGAGFKYHQSWIWVKNSIVLGHGWAHYQHEPILVGWKEGAAHYDTGRRDLSTVLNYDRPTRSLEHPTMKPLDLIGYLIEEGSKKGDLCLDLFGGSGSTLIACEQAQRSCYTMEIDPRYADVIVKRYLRYKGTKEGCYLLRDGVKLDIPQEFLSVLDFNENL